MLKTDIPGYNYGQDTVSKSPLTMQDLDELKQCVLFSEEDVKYLHMAGDVLKEHVEEILDIWYDFIGSHSFLLRHFSNPECKPDEHYLSSVRARFGQWIMDTCYRPYDQDWLNYQWEIALRHAPALKNQTDHATSTPYVNMRYVISLIYPITATIEPFLSRGGHSDEDVQKMYQAWFKSVTMQIAIWNEPHIKRHGHEYPESKASI